VVVRIFQTIEIPAPADEVWRLAGRPELIADFHPDVSAATVAGEVRTSTLADGSSVVERIVDRSIVHRFYTYELVAGVPGVRALRGCLAVRGHGNHSHLDWDVRLEAERAADEGELARGFEGRCREALERLRAQLERSVVAA
jgi:polyketide cyclase/dehydrase/lipid transport protein